MKLLNYLTMSILTIALLLAPTGGAYANSDDNDKTDRLSQNQSYTFSPGYINAAKQRADDIVKQVLAKKDKEGVSQEENVETIKQDVGKAVKAEGKDKATLQLKGPQGGGETTTETQNTTQTTTTTQLQDNWKKYGDATGDGIVDMNDLAGVLANYNRRIQDVDPATFKYYDSLVAADFNNDGVIDATDLAKVLANYNQNLTSYGIAHYVEVTVTKTTTSSDNSVMRTSDNTPYYADHNNAFSQNEYMAGRFQDFGKAKIDTSLGSIKIAPAKAEGNIPAKSALSPPVTTMAYKGAEWADEANRVSASSAVPKDQPENQKIILESMSAILKDANKVEQESGTTPELTKAQSELLQMVANVLLAQAMPDLLKSGDMAGIKDVFKDLDIQKNKVMLDYQTQTQPYYESIKKDLSKNMAILQMNNIFSKGMLESELKNASRSDIDKIIEKLKKTSDKFFEKDYILQQEAKYREKFLDPNKKKLEADTRTMLNEFTKRLSEKLEQAKK